MWLLMGKKTDFAQVNKILVLRNVVDRSHLLLKPSASFVSQNYTI